MVALLLVVVLGAALLDATRIDTLKVRCCGVDVPVAGVDRGGHGRA